MTIIEFIKSLSWEMNTYDVFIIWEWQNRCRVCGFYYLKDDDELSLEGCSVGDFKSDEVEHVKDYPDVYNTKIEDCSIKIEKGKIFITCIDTGDILVCDDCEDEDD